MNLSLRARFALATGGLVVLVAAAVAAAGYLVLRSSLMDEARAAAAGQAAQLVRQIDTAGGKEATGTPDGNGGQGNYVDVHDPSLVGQLVRPGLWVAVAGPGGKTLHASAGAPDGLASPRLVAACRRAGSAEAHRGRPEAIVACRRIGTPRHVLGFVVSASPLAETNRTLSTTLRALVIAVVLGGLGSFGLAWLLAARSLRPLRLIARAARSIRQGDLSERIGYRRRDELGELAAELDASFAELEGALLRQERFVADASHELKTPLAAAQANVQLLRRWAVEDADARAGALAALERSTVRMGRIVADLLQLARGDDRLRYAREPVRLDDLLLEAQQEARALASGTEIVVGHIEQVVILGDRDRLQQLLANLLDNAVRVTPAGGEIRLALESDDGQARITVRDEGPGIAPDELAHVFERFYRGQEPASGMGSGLGLSIARTIARAHGGELQVTSTPGEGSTFTVALPLQPSSDRHLELTLASPRPSTVQGETKKRR